MTSHAELNLEYEDFLFEQLHIAHYDLLQLVVTKFENYILKSTLLLESINDTYVLERFFSLGLNYGYYYQYVDDVLDYQEDEEKGLMNIMNIEDKETVKNKNQRYETCMDILDEIKSNTHMKNYLNDIDKRTHEYNEY